MPQIKERSAGARWSFDFTYILFTTAFIFTHYLDFYFHSVLLPSRKEKVAADRRNTGWTSTLTFSFN